MSDDITIDRDRLYQLYMDHVDRVCDECDWVTSFTPKDIVNMISHIIELYPDLIKK
jgi:hypothetical protein